MSPYDVNDISALEDGLSRKRCVFRSILAFPITALEAKHPGRGAPSGPLRRRQGLTEYSLLPRLLGGQFGLQSVVAIPTRRLDLPFLAYGKRHRTTHAGVIDCLPGPNTSALLSESLRAAF